jgi:hypothetical protein
VFVAAGDATGDGRADIAVGAGAGGIPLVQVFDGMTGVARTAFTPYDPRFTGGVRVSLRDLNNDGAAEVVTAPGSGGGPDVRVRDGATMTQDAAFLAFDPAFLGGVFVG